MTFTLELDVLADPAEVFRFVADFTSTPRWYSAVQHVSHVTGNGGAGTQYEVHRRLPSGPAVNTVEVADYTEGRVVTFASVAGPTPFAYRYEMHPAGRGTRLQLEGSISAEGLPGMGHLLGPLAEPLFRRGMQENLGTLKALLQTRRPASHRGMNRLCRGFSKRWLTRRYRHA
ncbi:SRPBCC family protein [Microbacterium sp. ARD32]|uniref:SRPBCC family protein n=1 Tax=Microbacterium sp. ARD32 TaxID=2962577 RepID=UPI002881B59D|nr:SRPBCC family protein [Microbacterium sp. ARD32]MDT0157124.1 SRPBCC family protein [Microbacterium sp. ARD32]